MKSILISFLITLSAVSAIAQTSTSGKNIRDPHVWYLNALHIDASNTVVKKEIFVDDRNPKAAGAMGQGNMFKLTVDDGQITCEFNVFTSDDGKANVILHAQSKSNPAEHGSLDTGSATSLSYEGTMGACGIYRSDVM